MTNEGVDLPTAWPQSANSWSAKYVKYHKLSFARTNHVCMLHHISIFHALLEENIMIQTVMFIK